jgi:hypothetical protein
MLRATLYLQPINGHPPESGRAVEFSVGWRSPSGHRPAGCITIGLAFAVDFARRHLARAAPAAVTR